MRQNRSGDEESYYKKKYHFQKSAKWRTFARSCWKKIEDIDFEFPKMSLDEFRLLFFGTYQIKQARTYVEEHFNMDSDFIVEVDNSIADIVRCSIQSRHSNAHKYKAWIQYSLTSNPIRARYCQCKAGGRTVGRCAHIASVIWYLCYARHTDFIYSAGRRRIEQAIAEAELSSDDD